MRGKRIIKSAAGKSEGFFKSSTYAQRNMRGNGGKYGIKIFAVCFWLLVWELLSLRLNNDILLASPFSVIAALFGMVLKTDFWQTILFSSLRIILGFLLALAAGTLLAAASYRFLLIEELLSPLMRIIRAMPVASFIILVLIWIKSKNLSVLISFMMVMPIVYSNVIEGLNAADEKLLQMAKVFGLGPFKKVIAIYIPAVTPFFLTAVSVSIGFCWKAGVAAEVIGIPAGSIGERLYEAKLYLMTKELLAWTIVIILLSILFEKAVLMILRLLRRERRF